MLKKITIAVDAMGGDNSPEKVINGICLYSKNTQNIFYKIFGDSEKIKEIIPKSLPQSSFEIIHTKNEVKGTDSALSAAKRGKETSMWLAIDSVKNKESDIIISAGNTGALFIIAKLNLKMIDVETGKIRYKYSYDCDCSSKELLISGLKNAVEGGFGVKEVASIKDSNISSTKTMSSLIVIKSTPQNARVHLGGKYVGKTPLSLADYKKGNYSMMVLLPGFKTYRSNIKITGKSEDIQIKLEKK